MSTKHDTSSMSLVQAVETLSRIADLDLENEIGVAEEHDLVVQDKKITYKTIHWVNRQNAGESIELVKGVFKVILGYLRRFYNKEYHEVKDNQTIEGIKTIMVLVGEAAKKLDKYATLFNKTRAKSVQDLREYKQLQEFYLTRIARRVDDNVLSHWLLALTAQAWGTKSRIKLTAQKNVDTKHVFIDLDVVKKDSEYELFFLRKEDGSRFYSPRLLRNIKLVCDFGQYFEKNKGIEDPLEDLPIWRDRIYQSAASSILRSLGNNSTRFYREAIHFRDKEIVELLNKCLMALMLAANPNNHLKNLPHKCCEDYFYDFYLYLRKILNSIDYHHLITYPPKESNQFAHLLLDLTHALCMGLFQQINVLQEVGPSFSGLMRMAKEAQSQEHEKAAKASHKIWSHLSCEYVALSKFFKHQGNRPILKVLDLLQSGEHLNFDPLWQGNLPNQEFALLLGDSKVNYVRIPSPTEQEFIQKASVVNEFKGMLRGCFKEHLARSILMFNLQDRTSWREHSRCKAIEELQQLDGFSNHLTVVTLAKDTEFYHQISSYQQDNHALTFISTLKEHLQDDSTGFYFPEKIKEQLIPHFTDGVIDAIHRLFFSSKNILLREHRMDFIEIFYMFLQLKILELVKPDFFTLMCKDGIDAGPSASAQLFIFVKLLTQNVLSEADQEYLHALLYAPSILIRERIMLPERFNRTLSAVRAIESTKDQLGKEKFAAEISKAFGDYFNENTLKCQALIPRK